MTSRRVIEDMREWLRDVFDTELCADPEIIATMDDAEVIAAVDRFYIGGKLAFLTECEWDAAA